MSTNGGGRTDRRGDRRSRQRVMIAGVAVVALLVGTGIVLLATNAGPGGGGEETSAVKVGKPAQLTMLALQADPSYVAVVGTRNQGPTSAIAVPPNVLTALPEVGSGTVASAVADSGATGRMAASNVLGTWVPHYALIDEAGLAELVERRGGLTVTLPPRVTLGGQPLGPGPTLLNGQQVVEYLRVHKTTEQVLRWQEVLRPLLAEPITLDAQVVVSTDDMEAVGQAFANTRDASVTALEADVVEGGLQVVSPDVVRRSMAESFGIVKGDPMRVIVLDGTGPRSVAEEATNALIPAGYQISAYGDARGANHKTTIVYASLREALPHAEEIREALGVGRVMMSKSGSGLGDVTVLIGKDFLQG